MFLQKAPHSVEYLVEDHNLVLHRPVRNQTCGCGTELENKRTLLELLSSMRAAYIRHLVKEVNLVA